MSSIRLSVHRHVFPIALKPNRTKSRNLQVHKYVKALTVNAKETQLENMHMEPYSARPVVSMSGSFAPRRPSAMSGDTFSCPQHLEEGDPGISWVEMLVSILPCIGLLSQQSFI